MSPPHKIAMSVVVVACVLTLFVSAAAAAHQPASPVREHAEWVAAAANRPPLSDVEARAHFSDRFLDQVGGTGGLNSMLAAAGPLRLRSLRLQPLREQSQGFALFAGTNRQWHAVLLVGPSGRIDYLALTAVPTSWGELDDRLRAAAPNVSVLAAELSPAGRCQPRYAVNANTARPLGSAFKLYVLGALAQAVRAGTASWDEPLAVRDEWKAGEGEVVGTLPVGTILPLREYASHMIFYSDNSATDHLMHRVGRKAVQAQQARFGMRDPHANVPFLTSREMFQLKGNDYPTHTNAYLALNQKKRARYLTEVLTPLSMPTQLWQQPRHINDIEWFASPADICRAFAGLRAQDQDMVDAALSQQGTTGLGLNQAQWPTGWYKGGSEPGVLTRNYLATTHTGRTMVVSMMISDPRTSINDAEHVAELHALIAGALQMME